MRRRIHYDRIHENLFSVLKLLNLDIIIVAVIKKKCREIMVVCQGKSPGTFFISGRGEHPQSFQRGIIKNQIDRLSLKCYY